MRRRFPLFFLSFFLFTPLSPPCAPLLLSPALNVRNTVLCLSLCVAIDIRVASLYRRQARSFLDRLSRDSQLSLRPA